MKTEIWILQRGMRLTPSAMAQMEREESAVSLVHPVRMDPMVPTET